MKAFNLDNISIIFYTSNVINGYFAGKVRDHLLNIKENIPLISVSQRPMNFGKNICVGNIGTSTYNIYKQILIGAKEVDTEYLACAEDDCLYTKSHLSHRPPDLETFSYNNNRWNIDPSGIFFHRNRAGMCMCIAPTQKLIDVLEDRFKRYPVPLERNEAAGFSEPGRDRTNRFMHEDNKIETFSSFIPTICFNHRAGLGGRRRLMKKDVVVDRIDPWGKAVDLWKEYTSYECDSRII